MSMRHWLKHCRWAASAFGFAASLVSFHDAQLAIEFGSPSATVAFAVVIGLVQVASAARFSYEPGRRVDRGFVSLFGVTAIFHVFRFAMAPFWYHWLSPVALFLGLLAARTGSSRP